MGYFPGWICRRRPSFRRLRHTTLVRENILDDSLKNELFSRRVLCITTELSTAIPTNEEVYAGSSDMKERTDFEVFSEQRGCRAQQ